MDIKVKKPNLDAPSMTVIDPKKKQDSPPPQPTKKDDGGGK